MGILIIDSIPENLEHYKKAIGEENNHFVTGMNESLMLLETVYEFDLTICNYKLTDGTGRDLHENFRMLPETETVPMLFIIDEPDSTIEAKVKTLSLADILVSPTDEELNQKIQTMLNPENDYQVNAPTDDFSDESNTAVMDNQIDFDSLMNQIEDIPEKKPDDNQIDFDAMMGELNDIEEKTDDYGLESSNKFTTDLNELSKERPFSGNIKDTPFSDILMHILENNYTTKIILKNDISDEECEIKIKDKYIVEIEMEDFDIEDTLFWVLNWDIAGVEISLIDDIENENCEIPIEEIIEEVINKRTEFEELSETLPDLDTILIQTSTYDSNLSDFEEEYKKTIELFDGVNTINDILSLIDEDNIYTLTIISQLYMDEILVLPEENNINKEELSSDNYSEEDESEEDEDEGEEDEDELLSSYLTEEDEELEINSEILESDDNFEQLDKEKYIDSLIESFKEEEEIIIKPKASPFKVALLVLFLINLILTAFIFIYKKEPQKIVINNIEKHEKIIKKIEIYHLGLQNKVNHLKNNIDIVNEILKQRIFKQKRNIMYENILKDKKYGIMIKKADFYVLKGNYKKAIFLYKKVLEKAPNQNDILLKLATAYYNNEDNNNAIKIIEKLDFLKNNSLNFIFLKAQVYQSVNNFKASIVYYMKFLKRSKDNKLKRDVKIIVNNMSKKVKIVRNQP